MEDIIPLPHQNGRRVAEDDSGSDDLNAKDIEFNAPQDTLLVDSLLSAPTPSFSPDNASRSSSPAMYRRFRRGLMALPAPLPFLLRRSGRLIRLILGPSTVRPIPPARPSLGFQLTWGRRSFSFRPDPPLYRFLTRHRTERLIIPFLLLWAMLNVLLMRQQFYVADPPIIGCTASAWADWPPDTCGVNGTGCAGDLATDAGVYRCLGGCSEVPLGNPRWVGGTEVNGVPLVIGGNEDVYRSVQQLPPIVSGESADMCRADSWICPAAIHSGFVSRTFGGCVSLTPLAYPAGSSDFVGSYAHGVPSYSFLPTYPAAYSLSHSFTSGCLDLHPVISTVNAVLLFIFTLLLRPSPPVLFSVLLILGFAQITLVSDPANLAPDWGYIFGALPAVLLAGYWFYNVAFERTLSGTRHLPLEMALWQGGGYWIGIESSIIFARLPISRLGYGTLSAAGAATLAVIIVLVALVAVLQAWSGRKYGLLQYYLVRYVLLTLNNFMTERRRYFWLLPICLILNAIPGYVFRLHHYLYSLAAMPVLSLPNRISLFLQAFILGLFLDGVGRWGWESILQTVAQVSSSFDTISVSA